MGRRVLFVTPWYPSAESQVSGTFVEEHAKAAARSSEVAVLVVSIGSPQRRVRAGLTLDSVAAERSGLETHRLVVRRRRFRLAHVIGMNFAVVRSIWRIRRQGFVPDVLHANVLDVGVPVATASLLFRTPMVFTEHYSIYSRRALTRFRRLEAEVAVRRAKVVMPVSQSLGKAMESYGLQPRVTRVIPNVVDPTLFFPPPDHSERPLILWVGNLDEVKNPIAFLDGIRAFRDVGGDPRAVMIGGGPLQSACHRRAEETGLQDCVELLGERPKHAVGACMREAACLVMTSHTENLPCVALEALSCGTPVIAPAVGGLPEIIVDATLGVLVDVTDSAALAGAIADVIEGAPTLDREHIVARARSMYSPSTVGDQLSEAYDYALTSHG